MKFGFHLPHFGPYGGREAIAAVARRAEALGFDSVWAMDHLIIPEPHVAKFSSHIYEQFTVLGYLAGCTEKIKLGTSVTIVPYRHPIEMAKIVATLDGLSGGRVIFGAAVGWMKEEFDLLGVPFAERGARTDEALRLMKELWTSERPNFQGRFYRVSDARCEPKPVQKPHPPIWIGGTSRAALRRAVALGDGWHPVGLSPEQLQTKLADLRHIAQEHGRDLSTFEISIRLRLSFTDDPVARRRHGLVGSPEAMVERIKQYEQLGVSTIVLDASFEFVPQDEMVATMERVWEQVIAHVNR